MKVMLARFFVYGSLMTGLHNHHVLARFVLSVQPASLDGMILLPVAPTYPGMVPGEGTVYGELVEVNPAEAGEALRALDELEWYFGEGHPDNDYVRQVVWVRPDSGGLVDAWAYVWNRGAGGLQPIPGGNWRNATG